MKGSLYSPRVRGRGFDARSAFFFFWCAVFSELFLLGTVCALTKEYLDLIDCNYATELYAAVRRTSMHMYIPAMFLPLLLLCVLLSAVVAAAAAACCRCCSSSCARWQNLLLWFVASDSSDLFLFVVQARLVFYVRIPWQYCRICSLDLPIFRIIHDRKRACAEPRLASARRDEASLVFFTIN